MPLGDRCESETVGGKKGVTGTGWLLPGLEGMRRQFGKF